MKHRLYVPGPLSVGQTIDLQAERAHYVSRVLRLRKGGELLCFDGSGTAWRAVVVVARNRATRLRLTEVAEQQAVPEPRLHLVQGLLKGNAMDQVMQKATELGATDIWPIQAARSNVPADEARQQRRQAHWQKIIESACEQCGQLHPPMLHPLVDLAGFLGEPPPARLIMLSPGAAPLPVSLPVAPLAVLIGPEGGWTPEERRLAADRGAALQGLGSLVLRAETAPLAALAAIRHGWGWVGTELSR